MFYDGDDIFSDEDERRPTHSIFTLHGAPILIHLHKSLSIGGSRAIANKIEGAGGYPYASEKEARVIICRYGTPIFTELEFLYDHERYKWVEPPSWVDTCIDLGKYEHHYLPSKADKTQKWHNSRTPFSIEDDENLVQFLAHRIPYKDSGGRLGNGVYKDLCSDGRASRYPWAKRHPWQSWRDRYTKNQDIFDPRIAYAVKRNPDPPKRGGKGQYVIPRKKRKPKTLQYNVEGEEESDDDEFEEEERQEVQLREEVRRWREEEEEEEEGVLDPFDTNAKKRSRQESYLQDGETETSRQSLPPPRKQPRVPVSHSDSENGASVGMGQDKRKGKGRQVPSESEFERPENMELNDALFPAIYDDSEPGPSQRFEEPSLANIDATMKPSEVTVANRQEPQAMALPLNVTNVHTSELPAAAAKLLPDTQMTLVSPTHRRPEPKTVPHDTQATVVPTSPRTNPERAARTGVSREPAQQRSVAYNTRSRRQPEDGFIQLTTSQLIPDKKRRPGRLRSGRPLAPYVSLPNQQQVSTFGANTSHREEIQVEEILQVSEDNSQEPLAGDRDGDSSSGESLSSEDDEATRILRNANKQMISEGARSRSQPRSITTIANLREVPHIDISSRPSRKTTVLRQSSTIAPSVDPDPDATPKAKPVKTRKAAKKIAAREPSELHDSDSDLRSSSKTDATGSSFPVETTNAREYLNAQSQFTPAPGTKAEEHIRSERSKSKQGSRRRR